MDDTGDSGDVWSRDFARLPTLLAQSSDEAAIWQPVAAHAEARRQGDGAAQAALHPTRGQLRVASAQHGAHAKRDRRGTPPPAKPTRKLVLTVLIISFVKPMWRLSIRPTGRMYKRRT